MMLPDTEALHRRRFARMLADLDLEVRSLHVDGDGAIRDAARRRALTPPLHNLTLAEGLISAVKLLALGEPEAKR